MVLDATRRHHARSEEAAGRQARCGFFGVTVEGEGQGGAFAGEDGEIGLVKSGKGLGEGSSKLPVVNGEGLGGLLWRAWGGRGQGRLERKKDAVRRG